MKLVKIFSRRVRTARRFVFENIMDLDHVCVLHKRWFQNLRVSVWRPDYVEYRLLSHFYGFTQDIRVRGAPLDEHRYWYEFSGRRRISSLTIPDCWSGSMNWTSRGSSAPTLRSSSPPGIPNSSTTGRTRAG